MYGHFIALREGRFLIVPHEKQLSITMESLGFEEEVLLGSWGEKKSILPIPVVHHTPSQPVLSRDNCFVFNGKL